jgi:hypothetical protein
MAEGPPVLPTGPLVTGRRRNQNNPIFLPSQTTACLSSEVLLKPVKSEVPMANLRHVLEIRS